MKKSVLTIILICLMSLVCAPAFSLSGSPTLEMAFNPAFRSNATTTYEPYGADEFPQWSLDLRRAECIFFGGLPIALPLTYLVSNLAGADLTFLQAVGLACSVSAVIALVDYILGVVNEG